MVAVDICKQFQTLSLTVLQIFIRHYALTGVVLHVLWNWPTGTEPQHIDVVLQVWTTSHNKL